MYTSRWEGTGYQREDWLLTGLWHGANCTFVVLFFKWKRDPPRRWISLDTPILPLAKQKIGVPTTVYQGVSALGLGVLFCLVVLLCIKSTYNPFIYFNF
jgi:hypothetical protein